MSVAIVAAPLSATFLEKLEKQLGAPLRCVSVSDLRQGGLVATWSRLRQFPSAPLYLPVEDAETQGLLPLLCGLALLTPARSLRVVRRDLAVEELPRWRAARLVSSAVAASVRSVAAAVRATAEMRALLREPRAVPRRGMAGGRGFFLNANHWAGPKAGGSIGHIAGVVNAMTRRGLTMEYWGAYPCPTMDENVTFHMLHPPAIRGYPVQLNDYRFAATIARQMQGKRSDGLTFLYQRMSVGNYSGAVMSRHFGVPLVLEYNGSEVWCARNWGQRLPLEWLARMAEEVSLRHAHLVVTVSEVLRDELIERGVDANRIVCYPNCVDVQVFSPDRFTAASRARLLEGYGIPASACVVMFVGTFGAWHGAEKLAEAVRLLAHEDAEWLRRHAVHFVFVGDGSRMELVRQTLAAPVCAPFYTLTGLVSQERAVEYVAASDVLVSPHVPNPDGTRFFGSPTKLFEYMAMQRGIVASRLEQIGDILSPALMVEDLPTVPPQSDNASVAVLCPPADVSAFVHGIRFLVERGDWREHLGRNARRRVLDRYTWAHHVDAILRGLEGLR